MIKIIKSIKLNRYELRRREEARVRMIQEESEKRAVQGNFS